MEPVRFIGSQCRRASFGDTAQPECGIAKMIEKRSAPRYKVLKGATIAFDGNGVECTVRNLSSSGAAIEVASPAGLPLSFMLLIEADQFIRRCRPVWRSDKRIGVAFD
jgi:hypothetical protein